MNPWAERFRARVQPLFGDDPCHDIHHLDRVWQNARHLAHATGADEHVLAAAAYLHDLDRADVTDPLGEAARLLEAENFPQERRDRVLEAIERHSDYSFKADGKQAASLEARVLQDADNLDAIGAVGIARTFAYAGVHRRPLWAGGTPEHDRTYKRGADGDTLQHFHDKLLRLRDEMNTDEAQRLAAKRHDFLQQFLDQFHQEAGAPDAPPQ